MRIFRLQNILSFKYPYVRIKKNYKKVKIYFASLQMWNKGMPLWCFIIIVNIMVERKSCVRDFLIHQFTPCMGCNEGHFSIVHLKLNQDFYSWSNIAVISCWYVITWLSEVLAFLFQSCFGFLSMSVNLNLNC